MARVIAAAIAATIALAVPLAGTGNAFAEPRTSDDVCALVPKETLGLGAGNPLRDGVATTTPLGNGSCRFASTVDAGGVSVELTVSTHRKTDQDHAGYPFGRRDAFERIYGTSKRVKGVGSRAWYTYSTEITRQSALLVVRKDTAVQVVLTGRVEREVKGRKQAVAIAEVALKALDA